VTDNTTPTPTAHAILDALGNGPATSAELRERTGRGRSTIDKALAELAGAGHVTKTPTDDGPAQWAIPDHPPRSGEEPDPAPPAGGEGDEPEAEIEVEVKVCRGCGDQMPLICPTCNAKTTSYCGTCRATRATRRASGEPQILSSGLRKLTRGELEHLVLDVIRTHALPDHLGITGWTPARVGIYLPGRSTGAISNVLDKLAATGQAQLLGTDPKRYQPVPGHDEPDGETDEQPGEAPRSGIEIDSEQ